MQIVVTGRSGKLGGALAASLAEHHEVECLGRGELDLRNPDELAERLERRPFDALVNCAAMADIETCEARPGEALRVNAGSPAAMSAICRRRGARFVHFSTDYVLCGKRGGLKDESAPVAPMNAYAVSKLEGEDRVLEANPDAVVGRVSWIFGTEPGGFLEGFLRRALAGEVLQAVDDKYSKPTCAREIGRMVSVLIGEPGATGLFHLTHPGEPESWWSYGSKVLQIAHELGGLDRIPEIARQSMSEATRLQVARPVHTSMDPGRLRSVLNWNESPWELAARERVGQLLERA